MRIADCEFHIPAFQNPKSTCPICYLLSAICYFVMDYVSLGNAGLKVSRLCLGCMSYGTSKWRDWVLDEENAFPFFKQAVESGINFFDTADMYSDGASEEVTGRALKKLGLRREETVITTNASTPMANTPNEPGTSKNP